VGVAKLFWMLPYTYEMPIFCSFFPQKVVYDRRRKRHMKATFKMPDTMKSYRMEIEEITEEERKNVKSFVLSSVMYWDGPYQYAACPFIQCNEENFLVIEFWTKNTDSIDRFVEVLINKFGMKRSA
jgi:hypothetical protein